MPSMTKAGYMPPEEPKKSPAKKRPGAKKKRRKKRGLSAAALASLAVFLLACAIGAGTIMIYMTTAPYMHTFLPGTMLLGYPLGGATMEDARSLLDKITQEDVSSFEVQLTWDKQSYVLSASDFDLSIDQEATLDALWQRGHEGGMLSCFAEMLRLRQEPMIARPVVTYDMDTADELLGLIMQDIACEPENAKVKYTPSSATPFSFTAESIGYSLDLTGVRAEIEAAAAALEPAVIELEPQVIMPQVTLEDLQGATVLRSRVLTQIDADESAYHNVSLAADALGGAQIGAGERLSFNALVGARSADRGYLPASEPAYGEGVSGVGGGVCQVSSALYQLALLGGAQAMQRSAAVYPVDYCAMGQEAAVSDQGIDLVIQNSTAYPMFISARVYRDEETAWLELQLIGEALDGRYELVSGILEETVIEEPVYVRDHEGEYATYDDERVEGGEGKPGYTVAVDRVKVDGEGNELSRENISTDVYEAIPPAIYIGTQKRD